MFSRQKIALGLLIEADRPLSPTVFVKLMFLLRQESILKLDETFYDFVPYKYGPFSFALYQELGSLRHNGYVIQSDDRIELCEDALELTEEKATQLTNTIQRAIKKVWKHYGNLGHNALLESVYARYPWFTINSELTNLNVAMAKRPEKSPPAIYTAGYEGMSVDRFLDRLLRKGVYQILDVRANPASRKYGFSQSRFGELSRKLGVEYCHFPNLGIPSSYRTDLSNYASYQALLDWYEETRLPLVSAEIAEVAKLMAQGPSVLVCAESDVRCCHRSRLADAVARVNGLEVKHL